MRIQFLSTLLISNLVFGATTSSLSPIKTIQDFKTFMATHPNVKKIEDVLPFFDSTVFENSELMYKTNSTQDASPENPRVINFNENLIITFNGNPLQAGYDTLELAEFVELPKPHFEKHAHIFEGDTLAMQVAQKNPHAGGKMANCSQCHFEDWRPNWPEYNIVPGTLKGMASKFNLALQQKLEAFKQSQLRHPRYKFVSDGGSSFSSIFSGNNQRRIVSKVVDYLKENPSVAAYQYALLASVGGCRDIEGYIPFKPENYDLKSYKAMLSNQIKMGSSEVKSKIADLDLNREEYLKIYRENEFPDEVYESFKKDYGQARADDERLGILSPTFVANSSESASWVGVAQLRYVAQWMRLPMMDWSMVFDRDVYGFRAGGNTFVPSADHLKGEYETNDVDYGPAEDDQTFFYQLTHALHLEKVAITGQSEKNPKVDCSVLKRLSLEALRNTQPLMFSVSQKMPVHEIKAGHQ